MGSLRAVMKSIDRICVFVAGASLFAITLLIVVDVSLRYLANAPLPFTHDVISLYLTPAMFFLGAASTQAHDEHLSVDLFTARARRSVRLASTAAGSAIGLLIFALLAYVGFQRAWSSFLQGEVIASLIPWPAWASYFIVPAGAALMAVVCAIKLVLTLRGEDDSQGREQEFVE